MTQRQRIDLLDHTRWGLAPQMRRLGRPPRVLVGLLLVIDQLVFPSLVIKRDQFFSRVKILIQETGDQNMFFAVTDPLRVVQRVAVTRTRTPLRSFWRS